MVGLIKALNETNLFEANTYSGDPNVALISVLDKARNVFIEDVAKAVLHYSTLRTKLEGKGATYSSRGVSIASVKTGPESDAPGMAAEVKMAGGKIRVTISDLEENKPKSWTFPDSESPSSIAVKVSPYGAELLSG
jgi:hypothetical protein